MGRIFVIADIHGEDHIFRKIMHHIDNVSDDDWVIIAGDIGLCYGDSLNQEILSMTSFFPCHFIFMRGHADVRYWRDFSNGNVRKEYNNMPLQEDKDGMPTREYLFDDDRFILSEQGMLSLKKYPNTFFVRDEGQIIEIDGHRILLIPGGHSIDENLRKLYHYDFEEMEQLNIAERDMVISAAHRNKGKIDAIVSHMPPYSIIQEISNGLENRMSFSEQDIEYGKFIDEVVNNSGGASNPSMKICCGHCHYDMQINGKYFMTYIYPVCLF